jgi:hypothetical protein
MYILLFLNRYRGRIWQIVLGINLLLLLGAAIAIPFIILSAWPCKFYLKKTRKIYLNNIA